MHPSLFKNHPLCAKYVQAMSKCHKENPVMKFFGACNEPKATMDRCFREEKKMRIALKKTKRDEALEKLAKKMDATSSGEDA